MDGLSTEDSITKSVELISKKKRKRARLKANRKVRKQRLGQMLENPTAPKSEESSVEDVANLDNSDVQLLPPGHPEIQIEPTTTLLEKSPVKRKRRKKRSGLKALNKKVDPCSMDQNNVPSNPSMPDDIHGEVENGLVNPNISVKDVASLESSDAKLLPLGHLEIQTEATTTLLEKSPVKRKRRKKRSGMKALNKKVDPCSMDQSNVPSNPSMPDDKHGEVENGLVNPNISIKDVASLESSDAQLLPLGHVEIQTEATTTLLGKNPFKKKRRKKRSVKKAALNNSELIMQVHSAPIRPGDFCMMTGSRVRRKLLILDVNGLLADVVNPPPKDCKPDACFTRRAIFKRPYCTDFLKFCFERFDVGIWSSRSKKIIDKVVDYILGNMKNKLLFCWVGEEVTGEYLPPPYVAPSILSYPKDMSHSTQTMFKTLENKYKPLVCKELSKVWDRYDPNLPWERGDYDESNTLLVDDSPYKALLNPVHTAIFPHSYNFKAENDNSLGPGGDLRVYLEELLKAEHVQKYVEEHPFGQRAIDQTSSDWNFYSDVLCSLLGQQTINQTSSEELLKA